MYVAMLLKTKRLLYQYGSRFWYSTDCIWRNGIVFIRLLAKYTYIFRHLNLLLIYTFTFSFTMPMPLKTIVMKFMHERISFPVIILYNNCNWLPCTITCMILKSWSLNKKEQCKNHIYSMFIMVLIILSYVFKNLANGFPESCWFWGWSNLNLQQK